MKLIRFVIGFLVSTLLISGSTAGISQTSKPGSTPPENIALTSIQFGYGGYVAPFSIELTRTEDGILAVIDGQGAKIETIVSEKLLEDVEQIMLMYDVYRWDGFSGSDPMLLDGEGFHFYASFSDGSRISASGENSFPESYSDVKYALTELVQPVIDSYWAEIYSRPILDTNIRYFSLEYQMENGFVYPFDCTFTLRWDKNDAPFLNASISADQFAVEPYVQENMADNRSGSWYRFYGEIPNPPYEDLQALVEEYEIAQWNGWDEYTQENSDKPEFALHILYESEEFIDISGRSMPDGLQPFIDAATELILEYIAENRGYFVEWK